MFQTDNNFDCTQNYWGGLEPIITNDNITMENPDSRNRYIFILIDNLTLPNTSGFQTE